MKAFIFADAVVANGSVQGACQAAALMEVCGRPVIEFALDEVASTGVRDVTVFVGPDADRIRRSLAKGTPWSLEVTVLNSMGNEDPCTLLERAGFSGESPAIGLRGDVFHAPRLQEFQQQASNELLGFGQRGQVLFIRSACASHFQLLGRDLAAVDVPPSLSTYSLNACPFWVMDSLESVSAANMAMLTGHMSPPHVLQDGPLWLGNHAVATPEQVDGGPVCLGDRARVHSTARLKGYCSVGRGALVDRGVRLSNCIVLPGTYVGRGVELDRCIVGPKGIHDLKTGRAIPEQNPLRLSCLRQWRSQSLVPLMDRMAALLAFLLALLFLRSDELRHPLQEVIRGDKRLLGISNRTHEALKKEDLPMPPGMDLPSGVLGIADLTMPPNAPIEERWLKEVSHPDVSGLLRIGMLLRAVWFSARNPRQFISTVTTS